MDSQFLKPLPMYRCHKEVAALKIAHVVPNPRGFELHFTDESYAPVEMSEGWMSRHRAQAGGYLVVYEDGYKSWSPEKAFEAGYSRIPDDADPEDAPSEQANRIVAVAEYAANCAAKGNHSNEAEALEALRALLYDVMVERARLKSMVSRREAA